MGNSSTSRLLIFGILAVLSCSSAYAACSPDVVDIRGSFGQARFTVELADTGAERAQGLMFRESLPSSAGMLFVYESPQRASFWMKNTLIPLDMIFADSTGRITRVHSNAIPQDLTPIDGGDGVTTVLVGSCSLSMVHIGGEDAGDLFGRVEAIPREHVITAIDEAKTWNSAQEYIAALESRPLGPNIASFIGHSDIRTATMGLDRATRDDSRPTSGEQAQMERMLTEALDAGFLGMSSQQLLFDKIDGATCRSRTLPSTYAKPRELRRLKTLLRKRGRVLQSGPDITNPLNLVSQVAQSLPVLRRICAIRL